MHLYTKKNYFPRLFKSVLVAEDDKRIGYELFN